MVHLTRELRALLAGQLDRVRAWQRQTGRISPYLFPHLSHGARGGRRIKDYQGLGLRVQGGGVPRYAAPRFPQDGRPQHGTPRGVALGAHETHRP